MPVNHQLLISQSQYQLNHLQNSRSEKIAVNAICSGWVKTDMGLEQGADTAIWLVTVAPREETVKYWRDRKVISY